MTDENQPIPSAPIIEAVVDIDCDLITRFEQKIQATLARAWGVEPACVEAGEEVGI